MFRHCPFQLRTAFFLTRHFPQEDTPLDDHWRHYLDQSRERIVSLQRELVARPALGPDNQGQGEADKARFLVDELGRIGFDTVRELRSDDDRVSCGYRPNLVAVLPGEDTGRTLWFISHTDIVPAGDRDLWSGDPFQLRVEDDYLYGRGVEDNHHGLTASLLAVESLLATGTTPRINAGLLMVADEETGSRHGLEFLLKQHEDLFGPDDLFLVPDFGSPDSSLVEVAEKGMLWVKFTVHGRQCHASTPEKGLNSLLVASDLILRLRSLHERFDLENELFQPPFSTFEATRKEANVPNINTIPGKDVFYLDCRVLPAYEPEAVLEEIKNLADLTAKDHNTSIDCEVVHQEFAPATPEDSPVVQALSRAVQRETGVRARPKGIGGGTVAALIRRRGYPAAVWSTILNNAHQPDEHTRISHIIRDATVFASMLLDPDLGGRDATHG